MLYEIRIEGHLDQEWTDWLEGLAITLEEDGCTLLRGHLTDQAALHAVLRRIRDLGAPLLSVDRVSSGETDQNRSEEE
jgi:hypothetical protein